MHLHFKNDGHNEIIFNEQVKNLMRIMDLIIMIRQTDKPCSSLKP